jgi:hypothetical protein
MMKEPTLYLEGGMLNPLQYGILREIERAGKGGLSPDKQTQSRPRRFETAALIAACMIDFAKGILRVSDDGRRFMGYYVTEMERQ